MEKSREAFRTISEVAEWLDVPTHVLRFWESRFSQIKPVKRAGGRRYYRPSDMRIIGGVKTLLHDQGMTIRGVQKLFREQGVKHVSTFSPDLYVAGEEDDDATVIEHAPAPTPAEPASPAPAARSTRDAEPAPVVDEAPTPVPEAEELVFIPSRRAQPSEAPATPEPSAPAGAVEAAPEPPAPTIPPTPDVPDSDPADDDPKYDPTPGIAARLVIARRADLRGNLDALADVATRLKTIRDRMN